MQKRGFLTLISAVFLLVLITGCQQKTIGEAIVAVVITCEDSDNGLDYYHFGEVSYRNTIYEDRCLDSKTLVETYCINDRYLEAEPYTCEFSCVSGKCTTE